MKYLTAVRTTTAPAAALTEESRDEGDAVGEHGALDDVEVGQNHVDQQRGADRVEHLEQHRPEEVEEDRLLHFL